MVLFDAKRARPSLLWPGDRVRFRAITRDEFMQMAKGA
jgi:allophanate hydrolase subunit 1